MDRREPPIMSPLAKGHFMASQIDEVVAAACAPAATSLDPYGQLVKMLMPRSVNIVIYDPEGAPLWMSEGCESHTLDRIAAEALREGLATQDGFSRSVEGECIYLFSLRDGATVLGALAVSCEDTTARSFALAHGLLRPAPQVLARELANQQLIDTLRRDLESRDDGLALLLNLTKGASSGEADMTSMLRGCVEQMQCAYGAVLLPEKNLEVSHAAPHIALNMQSLQQAQRSVFAWMQVQRRTLLLNNAPAGVALDAFPYKLLACPIWHGSVVAGVLLLANHAGAADFDAYKARTRSCWRDVSRTRWKMSMTRPRVCIRDALSNNGPRLSSRPQARSIRIVWRT
jgi:hypothetical protein